MTQLMNNLSHSSEKIIQSLYISHCISVIKYEASSWTMRDCDIYTGNTYSTSQFTHMYMY